MKEKWQELLESLQADIDALTLAQIQTVMELFERGLSGYLVARVIKGEFGYGCTNWTEWHR